MHSPELKVQDVARAQCSLVTRGQALAAGMSDGQIQRRLAAGYWRTVQPGVYLIGLQEPTWEQRLRGACLFAGPRAVASHRAAHMVWALDGVLDAPVEILVPHAEEANLRGVVVHRSRKLDPCDVTVYSGMPVTNVERTLVDMGRFLGPLTTEKALESALRRRLTTPARVWAYLEERAGHIPGHRVIRAVMLARGVQKPAGSGGEVEFIRCLRIAGVPDPERQYVIDLGHGRKATVDFAWPPFRLAMEYDSYDIHGGRQAHNADLERQNAIYAAGWELLRYSGSRVRRDGKGVAAEVAAALTRRGSGVTLRQWA